VPALSSDLDKAHAAQLRPAGEGFKVGLVWAGSPRHANDRLRSCPLALFEPLTRIADIKIYSLQKERPGPQDPRMLQRLGIVDLSEELRDFTDTAAVIAGLDLVVSVDTVVLHLAATLGKPVWGLIPYSPDWRWMLHRQDSPWYPALRLFRQSQPCDWRTVIERVAVELEGRSSGRGSEAMSLVDARSSRSAVRRRKPHARSRPDVVLPPC
jgi:hypothetical protein